VKKTWYQPDVCSEQCVQWATCRRDSSCRVKRADQAKRAPADARKIFPSDEEIQKAVDAEMNKEDWGERSFRW